MISREVVSELDNKTLPDSPAMSPVVILLGLLIPIGILTWADWQLRRELPGGNVEK
jgi:hypothetical protein